MWTKLRLKNFRLFKDTGDIELAPLTFFIGPNSSGKSSLLKALVLLKESVQGVGIRSGLLLKTPFEDFGRWEDLILCGNEKSVLEIEVGWKGAVVSADKDDRFLGKWRKNELLAGEYRSERKEIAKLIKGKTGFSFKLGGVDFGARRDWEPHRFFQLDDFINGKTKTPEFNDLLFMQNGLASQLKNTFHIGPLRKPPEMTYVKRNLVTSEVGYQGELTEELLTQKHVAIMANMNLQVLELAENIKVEDLKDDRYAIKITNGSGVSSHIGHVGFGISQVLPIVVGGIVLPEGATLIVEQPEIHLNPKVQVKLTDFFIERIGPLGYNDRNPRQFIIETHSEHLLSRIRTRIAEKKLDPAIVKIYYCNDRGNITLLHINEYGQIPNWPEGFFFEEYNETMSQTRAMFSRKKKSS